jgi:hypothetical protein
MRWVMQPAGRWTGKASRRGRNGSCSMPADGQRQGRKWNMQHAGRCTEAGQEIDHAACRQMDRGRAGDRSYSMPAAEVQRQGRI